MKTIAAVIFDLDGTLLDTLSSIGDTVNEILRDKGFPEHPREAYRYFAGDGAEVLFLRALPEEFRTPEAVAEALLSFHDVYERRWRNTARIFPGIPELLTRLTRRGVRLAILSNKMDQFTKEMTRELLPEHPFEIVLGARPGVPKKPNPSAALGIAESFGLPPVEIAFVGDTSTDMKTGVNAGMVPIGVTWGFREEKELSDTGASVVIRAPLDLLSLF